MHCEHTIFDMFGGVRPMARSIGEAPSNVASWKRSGRIPAEKQQHILKVAQRKGLPITTEHVVFPLGRPDAAPTDADLPTDLACAGATVACDRTPELQRKDHA